MAWGEGPCLLAQSQGLSAGGVLPLQSHEACEPVPRCSAMALHTTVMLRESCPAEWACCRSDGIMDQLERFLLVASGDELTGVPPQTVQMSMMLFPRGCEKGLLSLPAPTACSGVGSE